MKPVLITIGSMNIMSYTFFMVTGLLLSALITGRMARYYKMKIRDLVVVFLIGGIGVFIGARLLNVYLNFEGYTLSKALSLNRNGFSLYGGLILGYLMIMIYSRFKGMSVYEVTDLMTPGLGVALLMVRIGCFLNGCCYGVETNLPWGMPFARAQLSSVSSIIGLATQSKEALIYCHPSQVYEAIGGFLVAAISYVLIKKEAPKGMATSICILIFTAVRWGNYYLRVYPTYMDRHPYFYPVLYGIIVSLAVLNIFKLKRQKWHI